MGKARGEAVFQTVNGCAAHSSRRVLTRHLKTCSLVILFTNGEQSCVDYSTMRVDMPLTHTRFPSPLL
jgi:hypothetical protein